jgi:hypothetical protein
LANLLKASEIFLAVYANESVDASVKDLFKSLNLSAYFQLAPLLKTAIAFAKVSSYWS